MGLVLLLTFVISGHGLGASGTFSHVVAAAALMVAPQVAQTHSYLGPIVAEGNPMSTWLDWEVLGVFPGGGGVAFMAGRFRVQIDGARSQGKSLQLGKARIGGALAGYGARLAGGCTSGLGLSGAAVLSISAFVFLGVFFASGLLVSRLVRGV